MWEQSRGSRRGNAQGRRFFAIIADFAQQVGGDQVEVVSLVPALADPHSWEPTPQDARAVAAFDILFVNGEGYEEWLWDLVSSASSPGLPIVELSVGLEPLPGPSHSVHHHAHDPHFWLSVPNAVHYVERITLALMELDPAHAQAYRERANAYQEQLWELDRWLLDELALILKKTACWLLITTLSPISQSATALQPQSSW